MTHSKWGKKGSDEKNVKFISRIKILGIFLFLIIVFIVDWILINIEIFKEVISTPNRDKMNQQRNTL